MLMSLSDGRKLDLIHPRPEKDLTLVDTAWALAQINQFAGRALRPYSVAEHSLLVREILVREFPTEVEQEPRLPYWGLMHDAHEAVVGDVTSPIKWALAQLGIDWASFDLAWRTRYQERFSYDSKHPVVKAADTMALAVARKLLMADQSDWPITHGVTPPQWATMRLMHERTWLHHRQQWLSLAVYYAGLYEVAP